MCMLLRGTATASFGPFRISYTVFVEIFRDGGASFGDQIAVHAVHSQRKGLFPGLCHRRY